MSTQLRLALMVTVAFGVGLGLSSCGSSSGSNGNTPSNNLFACQGGSSCTTAEVQTYQTCVVGKCGAMYTDCYGPGALQGNFAGGKCGDYFGCISKCGCSPSQACAVGCGLLPSACLTCAESLSSCVESSGCAQPACFGSTPDAGTSNPPGIPDGGFTFPDGGFTIPDADFGGLLDALNAPATCADLLACCNGMAAGLIKDTCNEQYTSLKAQGDAACMIGFNTFKLAGYCK